MIKDHEDDIKAFEKESQSGQDADAKAFATATLPTLREHLKMIRSIASAAGISATG
jgi:putative membrane protein